MGAGMGTGLSRSLLRAVVKNPIRSAATHVILPASHRVSRLLTQI